MDEIESKPSRSFRYFGLSALAALSVYFILDLMPVAEPTFEELGNLTIEEPEREYGFVLNEFDVLVDTVKADQFMADLFLEKGVPYNDFDATLVRNKETFSPRNFKAYKRYMFLSEPDAKFPRYFVHEPNPYEYYVLDFQEHEIKNVKRPIEKVIKIGTGVVESNLWEAIVDNGMNWQVAARMEDAFGYAISFSHILQGDAFKVIYEEEQIEGQVVGVGKLYAATFRNLSNEYFAFNFKTSAYEGYFDEDANTMKKQFLKSPVKNFRISSRYNPRRFHPVLRRVKAHLGTDFAAAHGDPIYATGNGIVQTVSRTKNNGNFVKIKHNKTYTTQYLHMSGFQKGIRSGVHVKQGDVIGYVGQTGLATGPHVCYRFYKNGSQVDPLRLNFPPAEPMPKVDVPAYMIYRDSMMIQLEQINYILSNPGVNIEDEGQERIAEISD